MNKYKKKKILILNIMNWNIFDEIQNSALSKKDNVCIENIDIPLESDQDEQCSSDNNSQTESIADSNVINITNYDEFVGMTNSEAIKKHPQKRRGRKSKNKEVVEDIVKVITIKNTGKNLNKLKNKSKNK